MQTQANANINSLLKDLENKDAKIRANARRALIEIGHEAVSSLCDIVQRSEVYKARWEAAKALGEMQDADAIPALVKALEDNKSDVVWLAAEGLKLFGEQAWPELFSALFNRGAESLTLRQGAHHVLRNQRSEVYDDLLNELRKSLEMSTVGEKTTLAAYQLLEKMKQKKEDTPKNTADDN
jgi:HEAT repeat protein